MVVGLLVGTAGLVTVPVPHAGAAPLDAVCDGGEWCVFKDSGFRGCVFDYPDAPEANGNVDGDYVNCRGQKVKDSISSYRNNTGSWLVMWEHPDGKGFQYCVVPGGSGDVIRTFNDKASSAATIQPADLHQYGGESKCNHIDRD
jgi:hypothetical protein